MPHLSSLLVFALGLATARAFSISTQPSVVHKRQGESVTLLCQIEGDDYDDRSNPPSWTKIQMDEETTMLNSGMRLEPFVDARFPELVFEAGVPISAYNPQILELKPEDSGIYRCNVGTYSVQHTLWVAEAIMSLTLWGYPDASMAPDSVDSAMAAAALDDAPPLTFTESVDGFVECRAVGGIPRPTLRLIDTSTDRQFDLSPMHNMTFEEGVKGMRKMHFVTSVRHETFRLERTSDGFKLRCEAHVADMDDFLTVTEKTLNLLYKAYVEKTSCDVSHTPATEGGETTMVRVSCQFFAKPSPSDVRWKMADTDETLENSQVVVIGDDKFQAIVQFPKVAYEDYVNVRLVIINEVNSTEYEVEAGPDNIGEVRDCATSVSSLAWILSLATFVVAMTTGN